MELLGCAAVVSKPSPMNNPFHQDLYVYINYLFSLSCMVLIALFIWSFFEARNGS